MTNKQGDTFNQGDLIEVSNNSTFRYVTKHIFLAKIENVANPFLCVREGLENQFKDGHILDTTAWKYARRIRISLKHDDRVIVWNDLTNTERLHGYTVPRKYPRYFFGWGVDGKILTYKNGCTSWSSNTVAYSQWDHYEIPEETE